MVVGLNLLYLLPGVVGGTETYARELIRALAARPEADNLVLFVNEESRDEDFLRGAAGRIVVCPVAARSRRARYVWEQTQLPRVSRANGVNVLHSLGYVGPIRAGTPHVVTIHDLNFLQRSVRMPAQRRIALGAMTFAAAHSADAILTMSEFSRGQIERYLRVGPRNVTVTHLAPRTDLSNGAAGERSEVAAVPYVLAFSSPSPHKNIPRLITAFGTIAAQVPHELRIVGHVPDAAALVRAVEDVGVRDRVRFMGYLPDATMLATLRGADLLAFPSTYEGFGLPIVDAHSLGVPVACSAAGALREVAGAAAVLFDPYDTAAMASALKRALLDKTLRATLIDRGRSNAARYSWNATAEATVEAYRAVAGRQRR